MEPGSEATSSHHLSGHLHPRSLATHEVEPIRVARGSATDYLRRFQDFAGPYKDYDPPGDRTPAVGEKVWGDHPYLPAYQDLMYAREVHQKKPDNLRFRGPFYGGVSETHAEYVNRGVLQGRVVHEYVRHYEEPGMKGDVSVTQSDYRPPKPMLARDKAPCLVEEKEKGWYKPHPREVKNPHAKELEYGTKEPEVVYVDEAYKRDFSTEHGDSYVCYHERKGGSKIKDPDPATEEMFLKNIRESHRRCQHPPVEEPGGCTDACYARRQCPGATPQRVDWLLQPMNNKFNNGVMLVPCECRNSAVRQGYAG